MALFDKDEATALRELFAGMDDADTTRAATAMTEAAALLRRHDYSFRDIVEEIDTRRLLLPTKVGAAIRLMDSTTLSEAASAFTGARRLMKNCGLTFAGIIGALDREPIRTENVQELKLAYRIEVERSRALEAELERLRASVAAAAVAIVPASEPLPPTGSPFRNFVMVATLLLGCVLAASIASTFADLFRPGNARSTPSALASAPVAAAVQRESVDRLSPPRVGWSCWRNRGIQGPCF
jgi:hypothetical protein